MEFKGIDKAVQQSQPGTVSNTNYSVYHMNIKQQQTVLDYSIVGIILVLLIVCIGIVVYRK